MSTIASKLIIGIVVSALALGSGGVQASITRAEEDAVAVAAASAEERRRAIERWDAAVESARASIATVAEPARKAAADVGDLATAGDVAELTAAIEALDKAAAGRDIGAIAARRDELIGALAVFRGAVATNAETVLTANPTADQTARDELLTSIGSMRTIRGGDPDSTTVLAMTRSAADRVIASHQANVAAAAATAAAAAAEAAARAASEANAAGSNRPSTTPTPTTPGVTFPWNPAPTELTIDAWGDFWPGCEVIFGEWDWWYPDSSGYVSIDPGYPYDIEVMEYEGRLLGVKSLPCVIE